MKSCKEKKQLLSGTEVTYDCELVALCNGLGILKYSIDQQWQVGSLILRPGAVTYGFYWPDRSYVLYKWLNRNGDALGDYFNIADSVTLSTQEFSWRDLVIDILVLPTGQIEVLDEDEMPEYLDEELKDYIESVEEMLLRNCQAVIVETTAILNRYVCEKI
jgi:predicted RNA-binding protein associated with RNAse of E/G family